MAAWKLAIALFALAARPAAAQAPVDPEDDDGANVLLDTRSVEPGHRRPAQATPGEENQLAVDAYRRGDLESARTHWMGLLPAVAGDEKARVLYDLGNVAFRAGAPLEAVGWYTAALRLTPRDADVWTNLEHARREAGLEPADRGDLEATARRVLGALTRAESELFAASSVLLWSVLLVLEALRGGRVWRRLVLAGGVLVALAFAPFLVHLATDAVDPLLAIGPKERPLQLRSEPRTDAALVVEVPGGTELERRDELPGWVEAELPNGTRGWGRAAELFALRR